MKDTTTLIFAGLTALGGGGWLVQWYKARPERRKLDADASSAIGGAAKTVVDMVTEQLEKQAQQLKDQAQQLDSQAQQLRELQAYIGSRDAEIVQLRAAIEAQNAQLAEIPRLRKHIEALEALIRSHNITPPALEANP